MTADYEFLTQWRVTATLAEVKAVLGDGPSLPRWWPAVYITVDTLEEGDENGVGGSLDFPVTRSVLAMKPPVFFNSCGSEQKISSSRAAKARRREASGSGTRCAAPSQSMARESEEAVQALVKPL